MQACCFRLQTQRAEADPPCSSVKAQSFAWYTSKKTSNTELLCIRCSLSHPSALKARQLRGWCLLRPHRDSLEVDCISKAKTLNVFLSFLDTVFIVITLEYARHLNKKEYSFKRKILINDSKIYLYRPFTMLTLLSCIRIIKVHSFWYIFAVFKCITVCLRSVKRKLKNTLMLLD